MIEAEYRGFRISSYLSPNHRFRWIYRKDEWIEPSAEFNLEEKQVTVGDCKRIIDGWLNEKKKPEQLSLF